LKVTVPTCEMNPEFGEARAQGRDFVGEPHGLFGEQPVRGIEFGAIEPA
jgi:hypothetical protein